MTTEAASTKVDRVHIARSATSRPDGNSSPVAHDAEVVANEPSYTTPAQPDDLASVGNAALEAIPKPV